MKYFILLLLVLSVTQFSKAQPSGNTHLNMPAKAVLLNGVNNVQLKHHQMVTLLLQPQNDLKVAQKTTNGISFNRVIAQSTKDSVGTYFDSVYLAYSPNRGSTYDYNDLIYPYGYAYNTSPMFNYAGIFTKPQVQFDTLKHWTLDPNTYVYGPYEEDIATYDTHENTITYKSLMKDSAINGNMNYINKFNNAYNIDTALSFNYISGVSDSAFKQFFAYNTSHLLTEDSTYEYHSGGWHLSSKSLYTYDGSNNLIQIDNYSNTTDTTFTLPLIEQIQYINTYDGSHRLITVASNYYNGTTFGPYVIDTFAYSGTFTYHNSWKEYQYDPINMYWAPMFNMSKLINMSGLPDTVTIQGYDSILHSWEPQTLEVISYNTAHYPDTLKEFDYNFTYYPAAPSYTTIYYYQAYLNTLEINPVQAKNDDALIYPNPVKDQFTIASLNIANGCSISVSVINADGQVIARQTMTWQGLEQISTKELVPGVYWVVIQDGSGNALHRQAIVKE